MDSSQSFPSTDDIRSQANCWSLAGDAKLLKHLEQFANAISARTQETKNALDGLSNSVDELNTLAGNVTNKFLLLQNTQFVENRVYEDNNELVTNVSSPKSEDKEDEETTSLNKFKQAVALGVNLLDTHFEKVQLFVSSDSDEDEELANEPTIVLRPKNPYRNPLPHRIGSAQWWSDDNVGLESNAKSESFDESPVEGDSQSDEEPFKPEVSKELPLVFEEERKEEFETIQHQILSSPAEEFHNKSLVGQIDENSNNKTVHDYEKETDNDPGGQKLNDTVEPKKSDLFSKINQDITKELAKKFSQKSTVSSSLLSTSDEDEVDDAVPSKSVTNSNAQEVTVPAITSDNRSSQIFKDKPPSRGNKELKAEPSRDDSKEVPKPAKRRTMTHQKDDIFGGDQNSTDLFFPVKKSSSKLASSLLFEEDDEEDPFAEPKLKANVSIGKEKRVKLFDDEDDDFNDLFANNSSKPDDDELLFSSQPLKQSSISALSTKQKFNDSPSFVSPGSALLGRHSSTPAFEQKTPINYLFDGISEVVDVEKEEPYDDTRQPSHLIDDRSIVSQITPDLGFIEASSSMETHLESSQPKSSPFLPTLSSTQRVTPTLNNETSGYKTAGFSAETSSKSRELFSSNDKSAYPHSKTFDKPSSLHNNNLFESTNQLSKYPDSSDNSIRPAKNTDVNKYTQRMPSLFEDIDSDEDDLFSSPKPSAKEQLKGNQDAEEGVLFSSKQLHDNMSVSSSRSSLFDDGKSTLPGLFSKDTASSKKSSTIKSSLFDDVDDDFDFFAEKKPQAMNKSKVGSLFKQSIENQPRDKVESADLFKDLPEDDIALFGGGDIIGTSELQGSNNDGLQGGQLTDGGFFKTTPGGDEKMGHLNKSSTDVKSSQLPEKIDHHRSESRSGADRQEKVLHSNVSNSTDDQSNNWFNDLDDEAAALFGAKTNVESETFCSQNAKQASQVLEKDSANGQEEKPLPELPSKLEEGDSLKDLTKGKSNDFIKNDAAENSEQLNYSDFLSEKQRKLKKEIADNFNVSSTEHAKNASHIKESDELFADSSGDSFGWEKLPNVSNILKRDKKSKLPLFAEEDDDDDNALFGGKEHEIHKSETMPPKSSLGFQQKTEDRSNARIHDLVSEQLKSTATDSERDSSVNLKSVHDESLKNSSADEVDFKAKAKPIGKLNINSNLKINPAALLPGAKAVVVSKHSESPTDAQLLTSLKDRVKIQVKRRPQSRRARQEALRISGIDFGADSASGQDLNNTQLEKSQQAQENNQKSDVSVIKDDDAVSKKKLDEDLFNVDNSLPPPVSKIHPEDEDEDLFAHTSCDEDDDDLFSTPIPKTSNLLLSKHLPKVSLPVDKKLLSNKFDSKTLFGDDDDDDDNDIDIFGSTSAVMIVGTNTITGASTKKNDNDNNDKVEVFDDPLGLMGGKR